MPDRDHEAAWVDYPERGSVEWDAWELVVAWVQEDHEAEVPLRLGDDIGAKYRALIDRVTAALREARGPAEA
jgi:hypothetical protein